MGEVGATACLLVMPLHGVSFCSSQADQGVHTMATQAILDGAAVVVGGTVGHVRAVVDAITSADDDLQDLFKVSVDLWVASGAAGETGRWNRRMLVFLRTTAMKWTVCAAVPWVVGVGRCIAVDGLHCVMCASAWHL